MLKRCAAALLLAPLLLVSGCRGTLAEQYEKGYRFGQEGPAGHLGGLTSFDRTDTARSECNDHADAQGVKTSQKWMDGCIDGALGRPADPPAYR